MRFAVPRPRTKLFFCRSAKVRVRATARARARMSASSAHAGAAGRELKWGEAGRPCRGGARVVGGGVGGGGGGCAGGRTRPKIYLGLRRLGRPRASVGGSPHARRQARGARGEAPGQRRPACEAPRRVRATDAARGARELVPALVVREGRVACGLARRVADERGIVLLLEDLLLAADALATLRHARRRSGSRTRLLFSSRGTAAGMHASSSATIVGCKFSSHSGVTDENNAHRTTTTTTTTTTTEQRLFNSAKPPPRRRFCSQFMLPTYSTPSPPCQPHHPVPHPPGYPTLRNVISSTVYSRSLSVSSDSFRLRSHPASAIMFCAARRLRLPCGSLG